MDDINITKLFESRSEEALSEMDKKYGAYCFACAKNILGSDEDAKECLNDTYLCLWNSIPPQKPENLRAFAAKICRNLALNMFRKKNTEKRGGGEAESVFEEISEFVSDKNNVEKDFENRELVEAMNLFLEKLPPEKRKIFVLHYWFFESLGDIAKRFGKTEDAIRNTLFRTRKKLKKYLSERGFEP